MPSKGMIRESHLVFLAVAIGAQRFLLPDIYPYACLLPYILSLKNMADRKLSNTYLLISIFLSVDNGSTAYHETVAAVRYVIYLTGIAYILHGARFSKSKIVLLLFATSVWLTLSIINIETLAWSTFYRDILVLLLLVLVFTRSKMTLQYCEIDLYLASRLMVVFILFELINYLYLFNPSHGDYLSFNSTKAFATAGALIILVEKRWWWTIAVAAVTTIVLIGYATRFIPLVFFGILIFTLLGNSRFKRERYVTILLLIGVATLFPSAELVGVDFEKTKVTWLFYKVATDFSMDSLRLLDPVRFDENDMFFSRNLPEILFGSGLGSGLRDSAGLMSHIRYDQFAFSKAELDENVFHGLHDMWTDIGLRFGFLTVVCLLFLVARRLFSNDKVVLSHAMILLIMITCSFYSTAGLLMTAMLGLSFRSGLTKLNQEVLNR